MRSDDALLRRADLGDLEALERMETVCFQRRRFRREHIEWILRNGRALTLVVEEGGRLLGALMLLFEGRVCRVLSVAVAPRARRRGLGTRLMAAAEDLARGRRCASVRLEVSTENAPAIELYRTLDYTVDGLLPAYYSWGEDAYSMHKPLAREPTTPASAPQPSAEQDMAS